MWKIWSLLILITVNVKCNATNATSLYFHAVKCTAIWICAGGWEGGIGPGTWQNIFQHLKIEAKGGGGVWKCWRGQTCLPSLGMPVMVAFPMLSFTTFDLGMKKCNKTMYVLYYRDRGILDWMKFYFHITTRKGFYKSFRTMKKTQNMSRMASILHG